MIQTFVTNRHTTLTETLHQFGLDRYPMIQMEQTHGNEMAFVDETTPSRVSIVDALVTTTPNLLLIVRTADCIPILLHHPSGLAAVIHAGRKGTESQITQKTLQTIVNQTHQTEGYTFYFGPSICKNCYEQDLVTENVAQIWRIIPEGLSKITLSNQCTSCENDQFFSYRKERTDQRLYSGIMIK